MGGSNYPNSPEFWSYQYGRSSLIAGMVPSGKYRLNFITQPSGLIIQTTLHSGSSAQGLILTDVGTRHGSQPKTDLVSQASGRLHSSASLDSA
jgi:hypothetical protein